MSEAERLDDYEASSSEIVEARRGAGRAIVLVLAGIGIGAGLALLLTPRRGDEIREAIGRGYRRTIAGLSDRAQELRERAHDLREDLRERAPNLLRFAKRRLERRREG